jgi:TnpA family transposase
VPDDLTDHELAHYYTLTPEDLRLINRRRRGSNRLGFAVQLCMLRFPGRTITDLADISTRVLALIAQQVGVPPAAFVSYGQRLPTIYEHLDEIRTVFGYRNYDWRAMRMLARVLLPQALESDRPLPLAAAAL